ncbi:hypothetical protein Ancab_010513 [Ancistrocladus abbreviatus]
MAPPSPPPFQPSLSPSFPAHDQAHKLFNRNFKPTSSIVIPPCMHSPLAAMPTAANTKVSAVPFHKSSVPTTEFLKIVVWRDNLDQVLLLQYTVEGLFYVAVGLFCSAVRGIELLIREYESPILINIKNLIRDTPISEGVERTPAENCARDS